MTPTPFRNVDLAAVTYLPITKDAAARLYVVPLSSPLVVQTTPITLVTSVEDPDIPFVYVAPDPALADFFRRVEKSLGDACIENKKDWFSVAKNLDDKTLRRGFKSFFDASKGFKLKIAADVPCFDETGRPIGRESIGPGSVARAVIALDKICFGKHEYGATWAVTQLKLVQSTCLIADEPPAHDEDSDLDEFI